MIIVKNASHNNIFKINKELAYKAIRKFIKDKEIKEKTALLENIEINSTKEKGEKDNVEPSVNNLNKSDEIKGPYNNLISYFLIYSIAVLLFASWPLFAFFGDIGVAAIPIDLYSDNKKFLNSREEGIMTENTVNLKRDICEVIKKEIF